MGGLKLGLNVRNAPRFPNTCGGGGGDVTLGKVPTTSMFGSRLHRGINGNFLLRLQGCTGDPKRGPNVPAAWRHPLSQVRLPGPAVDASRSYSLLSWVPQADHPPRGWSLVSGSGSEHAPAHIGLSKGGFAVLAIPSLIPPAEHQLHAAGRGTTR